MDGGGILRVCLAVAALRIVLLRVSPATYLETELTMTRPLGGFSVKLGEVVLLTKGPD
jgi:hypothetical protein